MKKILVFALTFCLGWQTVAYGAQKEVVVTLDERTVTLAETPIYEKDRMMLPVRALAEALDADATWNSASRTAIVEKELEGILDEAGNPFVWQVSMGLDTNYLTLMGNTQLLLENPPLLVNDRAYLPFRELAEAMNLEVVWHTDGTKDYVDLISPQMPQVTLRAAGNYQEATKSIEMTWQNQENASFYYGADYALEKWDGKNWQRVAAMEGTAVPSIAYQIEPGSTKTTFSLWNWENSLQEGQYRLAVPYFYADTSKAPFFALEQTAAFDEKTPTRYVAYAEFTI